MAGLAAALLAWLSFGSSPGSVAAQQSNGPPVINGPLFVTAYKSENYPNRVHTFSATDPEGDAVTWSIESTDSAVDDHFIVDANGNVDINPQNTLDFEARPAFTFHVRATDANGAFDEVRVTVIVVDLREGPDAPDTPTLVSATQNALTITWPEPDLDGGPLVEEYDLRVCLTGGASCAEWHDIDFQVDANNVVTTTLKGLSHATEYEVQARGVNYSADGNWSDSLTARTATASAPEFDAGWGAHIKVYDYTPGGGHIWSPFNATDVDAEADDEPLVYGAGRRDHGRLRRELKHRPALPATGQRSGCQRHPQV